MERHSSSKDSSTNGRNTSTLKGRHLHQRRGQRRRPSSPAFLKCYFRLLVGFLVALVIAYLAALSSFQRINELESVKNTERFDSQRNDESLTVDIAEGIDDDGKDDDGKDDDDDDSSIENISNKGVETTNGNREHEERITIGVASTVTGCGSDPFVDGAAVLKYSLDVHSRRATSKFKYHNYILYHPSAKKCVLPLMNLGYTLIERQTPIEVEEIGGDGVLRERIVNNGCCGEKELIKLEAFRLTDHPIIIHLDLDVLINKPIDDLLDFMMNPDRYKNSPELLAKIPIMWPEKDIPDDITFLFTKDYNVVAPKRPDKPYQGGFFVIKPSLETYHKFVDIVRKGDYDVKRGWGNKVGPFYGGMTIQGLFPWYYEYLHPGNSVELNRCKYNNMSDKPHFERDDGTKVCRTNENECEDCRFASMDDVMTFHFTICQKPWFCLPYRKNGIKNFELCRAMNRKWYMLRSEMEQSWGRSGIGTGSFIQDHYNGFCSGTSVKGYQQIQQPYGRPLKTSHIK